MVRNSANTNPHRRAEKVQMSATTLRVAPIRTCPAPAAGMDLLGDEIQTPRTNGRPGYATKYARNSWLKGWVRAPCDSYALQQFGRWPLRYGTTKAQESATLLLGAVRACARNCPLRFAARCCVTVSGTLWPEEGGCFQRQLARWSRRALRFQQCRHRHGNQPT
jgi:hypothetical protein